jgi:hypothetical protein
MSTGASTAQFIEMRFPQISDHFHIKKSFGRCIFVAFIGYYHWQRKSNLPEEESEL